MLKIDPQHISDLQAAEKVSDLFPFVQNAIELEHATIPPYLTAMFSIKPNTEQKVRRIIQSIVIEEMLHMTIASNILNALGGSPKINDPSFVPKYPTHLPMGIGGGLTVGLEKLSKDVVKNVFMEIEEPEHPLHFTKSDAPAAETGEHHFNTIGEFYDALKQKIGELAPETLPGDPSKQVTSGFNKSLLFPVITKKDVAKAIDIIVDQGEGSAVSPMDMEGDLAHYYRFEEIYEGRALVKDGKNFSFSGPEIPFDPQKIYPLYPNTKTSMLKEGSEVWKSVNQFNSTYRSLLNTLHQAFNGDPGQINASFGFMNDIKSLGGKLCAMPFPGKAGYTIGPTFEFE